MRLPPLTTLPGLLSPTLPQWLQTAVGIPFPRLSLLICKMGLNPLLGREGVLWQNSLALALLLGCLVAWG